MDFLVGFFHFLELWRGAEIALHEAIAAEGAVGGAIIEVATVGEKFHGLRLGGVFREIDVQECRLGRSDGGGGGNGGAEDGRAADRTIKAAGGDFGIDGDAEVEAVGGDGRGAGLGGDFFAIDGELERGAVIDASVGVEMGSGIGREWRLDFVPCALVVDEELDVAALFGDFQRVCGIALGDEGLAAEGFAGAVGACLGDEGELFGEVELRVSGDGGSAGEEAFGFVHQAEQADREFVGGAVFGIDGFVARGEEGLIAPIPDEAALEQTLFAEEAPVVGEVAGGVAHGVVVFALDEGALCGERAFFLVAAVSFAVGDACVHRGVEIDVSGAIGLLVVDGAGGVALFDPLGHFDEVFAIARFIAHGPEDDAGVIFIALEEVFHAIEMRLKPEGIFGEAVWAEAHAVGFDVGLGDDVEAEFIAEFEEGGVVGIMGGAHGVDVGAFHLQEVGEDVVALDVVSGGMIVVVAIDTLDEDGLAVVEELAVFDFVASEAGLAGVEGDGDACLIEDFEFVGVEVGCFCAPWLDFGKLGEAVFFVCFALESGDG